MGYGRPIAKLAQERKAQQKKQIDKLHSLAKEKSAMLYTTYIESLASSETMALSGAELMGMATFTGALFTSSVVFAIYYDLINKGLKLDKTYSEEHIINEMVKAIKDYGRQIYKHMKKTSVN